MRVGKRTVLLLTVVAAMLLACAGVVLAQAKTPSPSQQSAGDKIPGQYIVVLNDDARDPTAVARQHAQGYGVEVLQTYQHALKGYAARIPAERLDDVRADPNVQFVSEDRVVEAFAQETPTGVNRIEANLSPTAKIDGTDERVNTAVAVIDTGSGPHMDLNRAGGKNCSTGKSYDDGNGHGTHVAGTVAAKDNGDGVVGVAPGAPIYSVRVLNNSGSGSTSSVVCGIDWVTGKKAEFNDGSTDGDPGIDIAVANMSLGGGGSDDGNCGKTNGDAEHKAICGSVAEGVTYAVAAGNDGTNFKDKVPAAYDEVLTVTAMADFNGQSGGGADATCRTDVDDTAADFSNFTKVGNSDEGHAIAAPGVCIRSTWKGGGYNTISGTSMASPHGAGTVALCIASGGCSGLSPSKIITKLRTDASLQPASYGFAEDGNQVTTSGSRYYGYLEYAKGY